VGWQQLSGRAYTVTFQYHVNPDTVSAGRGIAGDGYDTTVFTAHFAPVGDRTVIDAAQLLRGQFLDRVFRVHNWNDTVGRNSERYDVNTVFMGLLDFTVLDPARRH